MSYSSEDEDYLEYEDVYHDGMMFLKDDEGRLFTTEMIYAGFVLPKNGKIKMNEDWYFWHSAAYRLK